MPLQKLTDCLGKSSFPANVQAAIKREARALARGGMGEIDASLAAAQKFLDAVTGDKNAVRDALAPEGGESFSLSPHSALEQVEKAVEATMAKDPEARAKMAEKVKENLDTLRERWRDMGDALGDLEARQELEMGAAVEEKWSAAQRDALEQRHKRERDALKFDDKMEALRRDFQTYNAMLAALPAEIRGKMGGYVALSKIATPEAREKKLVSLVDRAARLVEAHLAKEYKAAVEAVFEKSKARGGAGDKAAGKLGAVGHAWFDLARDASVMTEAQVAKELAAIDTTLALDEIPAATIKEMEHLWGPGTVTDDTTARVFLEEQQTILNTFGALKDMDAATAANALAAANQAYESNRQEWIHTILERRERRKARQETAIAESGGVYDAAKHNKERTAFDALVGFKDLHLSFEQQAAEIYGVGSETHKWVMETSRKAADQEADLMDERRREFQALMNSWPGGRIARLNRLMKLQERRNTGIHGPAAHLSEFQGVHLTMLGNDPGSLEWLQRHGYTDDILQSIEGFLSPEAKSVRSWLQKQYDAQYDRLNKIYAKIHGVNLPRVKNYAPRLVEHGGKMKEMAIDPENTGGMVTGFTRRRFEMPQGPPKLADALQAYWANQNVTSHWIAWAETMGDYRATIASRDARLSAETHRGMGKSGKLQRWVRDIDAGGVMEAIASTELGSLMRRWFDARSKTALFGKLSVLVKQIPAAFGAAAKVSAGEWMASAWRVMRGTSAIKAGEMFRSDVVQRRLNEGEEWMRPASKGAKNRARILPDSVANAIDFTMGKAGGAIGWTDARFTSFSAAVAFDANYREALKTMPEPAARAFAWQRTAEVVGQTAQPQALVDKSLMEIEWPTMGRLIFAFQGANRQAWSLMAQAIGNAKKDPGAAARVAALYGVVVPTITYILGGLIRYALSDDDFEDEFSLADWGKQLAAAPLQGTIIAGPAWEAALGSTPRQADTPVGSGVAAVYSGLKKLFESDEERMRRPADQEDFDAKDAGKILNGFAQAIGGRAAAIGVANNVLQQFLGVAAAVTPDAEGEKPDRETFQARKNRQKRERGE